MIVHVEESCAKIRITLEHLHCPLEGTLPINTSHIQQQTPTVEKYWLHNYRIKVQECDATRQSAKSTESHSHVVTMVTAFNILSETSTKTGSVHLNRL